jgi:hypothetical protein
MKSGPRLVRARPSMALFFIKAAHCFYLRTKQFEEQNTVPTEDFNAQIIGGIISAVSFLECYINEVYADAAEEDVRCSKIPSEKLKLISKMWNRGIPRTARYSILEKYNIFLDLVDAEPFDKGRFPYQDASILIDIRNEMVHFEPYWTTIENSEAVMPSKPNKFESKLKGRFASSKLHKMDYFFFPHYCFSSDCVRWAFDSAKELSFDFSRRANVESTLNDLKWEI